MKFNHLYFYAKVASKTYLIFTSYNSITLFLLIAQTVTISLSVLNYSHLKNLIDTQMHITESILITKIGSITLSMLKLSDALFKSFIP